MADPIDFVEDFELETRIVLIVVAAAADLKDHTAVALVTEGEDGSLAALPGEVRPPGP